MKAIKICTSLFGTLSFVSQHLRIIPLATLLGWFFCVEIYA